MYRTRRTILSLLVGCLIAGLAPAARAAVAVPDWSRSAVRWAAERNLIDRATFRPNEKMTRAGFGKLMAKAFRGGYSRTGGYVTAAEVDKALVQQLGYAPTARYLASVKSPDGWDPGISLRDGFEMAARELELRFDRPSSEEQYEASPTNALRKADIVYAIWKAKTDPGGYAVDALNDLTLPNLSATKRKIVEFAFDQVGTPYIYGGEWKYKTPAGYPYGAQPAGGMDCSGFVWYVMQKKSASYSPVNRTYEGWSLPERSSASIAAGAKNRLLFRELRPGDLMVFGDNGRHSSIGSIYHTALYIGNGWMIHSTGSRDGVSIAYAGAGGWWRDEFAWGRRIL
jgi:cell wall-associated NlpC family hydrolase